MAAEGENYPLSLKKTKSKTPKVMFGLLIGLGVATFALGLLKVVQGIYGPFINLRAGQDQNNILGSQNVNTAADLIKLQGQDTDSDGLSDYDETYVHKTSIYLADTDSDGYTDKQEVMSGHDPNCVAGQTCRSLEVAPATEPTLLPDITQPNLAADDQAGSGTGKADVSMTAAELRQQLLASGQLTEEQKKELEQVDDATLLKTFQQILEEQE